MLSIAPKRAAGMTPTGADGTSAPAAAPIINNRSAVRRPAAAVPSITGLRLSPYGITTTLVNISETGLLTECDERLKTGSSVTVVFEGTFEPKLVPGRVSRNLVAAMGRDGLLRYHVGIQFAQPIALDHAAPTAAPSSPEPAPAAPPPTVVRNRW